ncbi:MAG: aminopeptidase N [bacterium]
MYRDANPSPIYLSDYQPPDFLIEHVSMRFDLQDQGTQVHTIMQVYRNPGSSNASSLHLNGEGLNTQYLALNDQELPLDSVQISDEMLVIANVPDKFQLETRVEISPENNTALEGLYRSNKLFCTQCEAEGFRRITWFLDRPDVMTRFDVRIEADRAQYPVLLSNGNPAASGDLEDGRHFAEWSDPYPKPCYLFALVAGDLRQIEDSYQTAEGRQVRLRIYVEPENIEKCDHAMQSLINAMRWDEEKYGRSYDLDVYNIVAVNDFNMGAMENKGLNIFNSKYVLASPDTATDSDYQGIEGVIAHEYFHNWTGNRITCRDWFQLSLKEGLTVYRDQEFSADMGSRGVKRIEDVRMLRAHQFAEDASPMAHPVRPGSYIEINNFYTLTVYEKGAEVVRMQANLLGETLYRKATDLYFERFDGQAVTTEDFVQCMADVSGRDMTQFKYWYDYAGTPRINAKGRYDQATGRFHLSFEQSVPDTPGQKDKPAFHIPIEIGLLDAAGNDLPLYLKGDDAQFGPKEKVLELREQHAEFVFQQIPEAPVPSLLRGFSAPVELHYDYSDGELMFLMSSDNDGFNRWNAAQTLAERLLLNGVSEYQQGRSQALSGEFVGAFRDTLKSSHEDPYLIAEVLQLPSETYLGDQMSITDVDAIHDVRESARFTIARSLREDLLECYEQYREQGAYQPLPKDIGQRRLKNLVLGYLASQPEDAQVEELLLNQYGAHHNMTDVITALSLVADSTLPSRQELLDDFDQRWREDPLVMDKWFMVQALSSRETVVADLDRLLGHPAFSIRNPNKIRALIGSFANANPLRFHASNGSGYQFVTDRILEIDPLNPQISARMLRAFSRWRHFDEQRQSLMKQSLERILATANLSRDAYEIASKSLK